MQDCCARMIRNDTGDIDGKFPNSPPVEQVRKTMVETRHYDQDALSVGASAERPPHSPSLGDPRKTFAKTIDSSGDCEVAPHSRKEIVGFNIIVLVRFLNIS